MKLSAKMEYAFLAMLELALRYDRDEPVCIRDICDPHAIPAHYLVQILAQLKGAGLVFATRGTQGGYQLARPPAEISLGEVFYVMDGPRFNGDEPEETSSVARALHKALRKVGDSQRAQLNAITLGELADRARSKAEGMYYI
jgi:Rrf2 family protein